MRPAAHVMSASPFQTADPAPPRLPAVWLLSWLCVLPVACDNSIPELDVPPLTSRRDAAVRPPPIPDGAISCESDGDCRDDVDCTRDLCHPDGYCVSVVDNSRCSDGIFCNGQELCDPIEGCRPGRVRTCNDDDVCTVDRCVESEKRCVHDPRDFDEDGEIDWHCFNGTDCDDFDATRGGGASEICQDGVDNDCDGLTDETVDCGLPRHDNCSDALDVSAGGAFEVQLAGTTPDYTLRCGGPGMRDVAFTFELNKPQDVRLSARGLLSDGSDETATVAVRSSCDDLDAELECNHGFPGRIRMRALPAGRYFVIVNSPLSTSVVLDVRFTEPTPAPTNTSCQSPLDISAGGRFTGDLVDVGDNERVPCAPERSGDLIYTFTTEEEADVELSAISLSSSVDRMYFSVRTTCDDASSAIRCLADAPARGRLHQLPAGTYYVVLEGPSAFEVDFSLDVAFLPPTPPPPGDGCGDPQALELDQEVTGTLASRQDLVHVECGCDLVEPGQCGAFLPDIVYNLTLPQPADLRIELDAGPASVGYDLRSTCDLLSSQVKCRKPGRVNDRVRNLPAGDYFLVVESPEVANFVLRTETLPLTVPTSVSGNDLCSSAYDVPATGGVFDGSTANTLDDYQATCGGGAHSNDSVFRLALPKRSRVIASTDALFDTVLYRYDDDEGEGAAVCKPLQEASCNDDGGDGNTNSRLDEVLDAGTYYYVIDGFNEGMHGDYTFEVEVTAP